MNYSTCLVNNKRCDVFNPTISRLKSEQAKVVGLLNQAVLSKECLDVVVFLESSNCELVMSNLGFKKSL